MCNWIFVKTRFLWKCWDLDPQFSVLQASVELHVTSYVQKFGFVLDYTELEKQVRQYCDIPLRWVCAILQQTALCITELKIKTVINKKIAPGDQVLFSCLSLLTKFSFQILCYTVILFPVLNIRLKKLYLTSCHLTF